MSIDMRSVHFSDANLYATYPAESPALDSDGLQLDASSTSSSEYYTVSPQYNLSPVTSVSARAPSTSSLNQSLSPRPHEDYSDGIHVSLREPPVSFDLGGSAFPSDVFDEHELQASATLNDVSNFMIRSRSLSPNRILEIARQRDILTVDEVLTGIIEFLNQPAEVELKDLWRNNPELARAVDESRMARADERPRLIDWLPLNERVFRGLSSEQKNSADTTVTLRLLKVNSA
ncbi:hypothetical protein H0H92_007101 [Tricholoma furcatifolium]|nr:hypothetical protein H0H92_007101 [Tricholoma furcatifolium]